MARINRHATPNFEVHLLREGIVESTHQVDAVICDQQGRVLSLAGRPSDRTFIRSALKPFQALAVTRGGCMERYQLSDRDLAVICSSHRGTVTQARQVFNILWRANLDPSLLQCPTPSGKESPLEHNCSGKHAGMLVVCQQQNWGFNNYLEYSHPLQETILEKVAELLKVPTTEIMKTHDDCGAPTYYLSLSQMATLYAQLASGNDISLEKIVRAMTSHPEMVGGDGTFDTELMRLTQGEIVSKSGAEGIQCVGHVGEGMGLALKVKDGAKRAKYAAALHILTQLGWVSPEQAEELGEQFLVLSNYKRLLVAGELSLA